MKIYVGNLSYQTEAAELKKLFEAYGNVTEATIVSSPGTGKSRGFGFVEMSDHEEASDAIFRTNGLEVDGRKLVVNESKPKRERSW